MLATTISRIHWVDEFRKYTRGLYSLEACQSIFDDLINWQEKAGEIWVKNLTGYDVTMIYTEYKTLEEFKNVHDCIYHISSNRCDMVRACSSKVL